MDGGFGHEATIQVRAFSLKGQRPTCPRGCAGPMHCHGFYRRFAGPSGGEKFSVPRYLCPRCRCTVSVLEDDRLPYRPLHAQRLADFFNSRAEAGTGPDPPPGCVEAGCLLRAWARFLSRVDVLKTSLGQLIPSTISTGTQLWLAMRRAFSSMQQTLAYLAATNKRSLLGDYRCLRAPAPLCSEPLAP